MLRFPKKPISGILFAIVLGLGAAPLAAAAVRVDPLLTQVLSTAGVLQPIEAIATFNNPPTFLDLTRLSATGVRMRTFQVLPMVAIRGTRLQINAVTALNLPNLASLYHNRPLRYLLDESTSMIGAVQQRSLPGYGYLGVGVGVAVLDSGIDGLHQDLSFGDRVVQNVKILSDPFGLIQQPLVLQDLATTDTSSGHGTHCASIVGGSGAASGGRYAGVAPGADLIGVSTGELILILHALAGFDWILANQADYNIRVISNSWGTTGAFDLSDPVNVASKLAHDRGITVAFAAGNDGPGNNTLNPYSVAPWVIGVAAGDKQGGLADFSSRGIPGDPLYHPTLTAPGAAIVAARSHTGVITVPGLPEDIQLGADAVNYTTMSGTSMATPHVAGAVALLLEANPSLSPDQVKAILSSTATPMAGYQQHQVGAGYMDVLAALTAAQQQ